ncbi:Transient receptor potential cation channel subfamily M member-like 2 [Lamellibrachia satsuma]|nr:Transient receptor potential cation channel subfamily M member-like 2 [Lamellibrachia satsuma]
MKFLLVLALFIVSYGVPSRALLFPRSEFSLALLRDIVYMPYWQMYGELQLEDIEGDDDSRAGHITLATILFAVYMMMSHVLLLNLLIATFTYSITRIHADKKKSWHFYFRSLVREYERCNDVPPPFSIFVYVYQLCRLLICESEQLITSEKRTPEELLREIQEFQKLEIRKYLQCQDDLKPHEQARVTDHADKAIVARLQSLEETVNTLRATLEDKKLHEQARVTEPTNETTVALLQSLKVQMQSIEKKVSAVADGLL